jgi:2-dehydro-3-deoxy-L-rhamnonate dehydrogenase (NAD+)
MHLAGKVALVTGAQQGIGKAIALAYGGEGASVIVNYLDDQAAGEAVAKSIRELGRRAAAVSGSVSRVADVHSMVEAGNALGGIDILVNNAGIAGVNKTVWETDLDEWRKVLRINLDGPFICCKAIVPSMVKQNYGRIVNIASIAGKEGNPNAAHYSASKAGLIALTKSLGKELAAYEIAVNAVTPAAAKTAIFDQLTQQHIDFMLSKIPKGRFVMVEELAAMVAWLASEDCAFSTGAVFDISGGRATY